MENLDEILKSEPQASEPTTQVEGLDEPSPIVDPPSDRLRDEKGRFVPKETGVEEPAQAATTAEASPAPASQLPPEVYEPLKAERTKRQQLERELEALRRQVPVQAQPQSVPVDFWDDPQAFMDSRMNQLGQSLLQQWDQRQTVQRIDASEQQAKAAHADYEEAYVAFEQAVQANPRLAYELAQAENPGEFAYSKGKAAIAIQSVGSLDELKAQIRSELEAEARANFQPQQTLPSTTASDGSVGTRSGPGWSGPKPLAELLGK